MKKTKAGAVALGLVAMLSLAGCGGLKPPAPPKVVNVNTYKIEIADTRISSEYPGTIVAKNKVPIRSRVSGNVIEKYIHGGEYVTKGQALYKIDSRPYDSALAGAKAKAAQAQVAAENAQLDLHRYEILAKNDAIPAQLLDGQRAKTEGALAAYEAAKSQVAVAQDNANDTIIRAPFSGTLSMDDVDLGTFIAAGQVPLVTIQSTDPVLVRFSMSESQYLKYKQESPNGLGELHLCLSDNSIYNLTGHVVEMSKDLDGGSGQIMMKAQFDNPNHTLLAGMFGTILTDSKEVKNAILVPTKSLVQVLDKLFVMAVDKDGKIIQVPVEKTATQGYFTLVKGNLTNGEQIVVDGLTRIKVGSEVEPKVLTKKEIEKGE